MGRTTSENYIKMKSEARSRYLDFKGTASNGLKYEVIEYVDSSHITVKFEDGVVATNQNSYQVLHGRVKHPSFSYTDSLRAKHIGEINVATCGLKMTVIAFRSPTDIDIQFEDGVVLEHRNHAAFKRGEIKHPDSNLGGVLKSSRVGQEAVMRNGQKASVICYNSYKDVTVQFEDGTVVEHCYWDRFLEGSIVNPNKRYEGATTRRDSRVGESIVNMDGERMTIISYKNHSSIEVQFEDGTIRKSDYEKFRSGKIRNANWRSNKYVGSTVEFKNGLRAIIQTVHDSKHIEIEFETGYKKMIASGQLANKSTTHPFPYMVGSISIDSFSYRYNDIANFCYSCKVCGEQDIGSIEEIHAHVCKEDQSCEMLIS